MTAAVVGGSVVTPDGVLTPGLVRWSGNRLTDVVEAPADAADAPDALDVSGCWVVPGFVDVHCHGGGGHPFSAADQDAVAAAADTHRRHGTTTLLASLVSEPIDVLVEQIKRLDDLVRDGRFAGIHLEGPFLAAARCGAHDPAILRAPDPSSVRALLDAGRGTIRMVTLAPELDGAVTAVRTLADAGVLAAIGHTDAEAADVLPAVDAGATVATHLFNGMRPLHHREPGPVGVLLDDERVTVELIADGVHLHPAVVRLAARHAGTRTVLITDAIAAAGAGDGDYDVGGLKVTVRAGVPRLADGGSLAGSSLTMDAAFRNFVTHSGRTIAEAVHATATGPAALLGLANVTGALRPGLAADLVVLDADLRLRHVIHQGTLLRT